MKLKIPGLNIKCFHPPYSAIFQFYARWIANVIVAMMLAFILVIYLSKRVAVWTFSTAWPLTVATVSTMITAIILSALIVKIALGQSGYEGDEFVDKYSPNFKYFKEEYRI